MSSSHLTSSSLQSIAERGLCSFLRALAEVAPSVDPQRACDCWIRAVEKTEWSPDESADRFICHVTACAMASCAEQIPSMLRK